MNKKLVGILAVSIVILLSCFYIFEGEGLKNSHLADQDVYKILDKFFDIEYGDSYSNYSTIVNNPEFVDMLTLNHNRFKEYSTSKKFKVEISNIHEKENNNYIVSFKVLQGENMYIETDYTCLIQKENDKYYINRLVNNILLDGKDSEKFIENESDFNEYVQNFISSVGK